MYITTNFSWAEFACNSGEDVPDALKPQVRRLCETVLEPIRRRYGAALVVNSGYRDPAYNARIGGAKQSQHMYGTAADFHPVERSKVMTLAALIETMASNGELPNLGGFGVYRNWVHCDIRPRKANGSLYRWTGKGVGSEQ